MDIQQIRGRQPVTQEVTNRIQKVNGMLSRGGQVSTSLRHSGCCASLKFRLFDENEDIPPPRVTKLLFGNVELPGEVAGTPPSIRTGPALVQRVLEDVEEDAAFPLRWDGRISTIACINQAPKLLREEEEAPAHSLQKEIRADAGEGAMKTIRPCGTSEVNGAVAGKCTWEDDGQAFLCEVKSGGGVWRIG